MDAPRPPAAPPPAPDGGGRRPPARGRALAYATLAVLVLAGAGWWLLPPRHAPESQTGADRRAGARRSGETGPPHAIMASSPTVLAVRADPGLGRDLADVLPPGTPEPTMGEVIEALHAAGIRSGLGAFNPPGTSPPLLGLAVPPDFPLPEGYVRHHQVTDDGQDIEPILMFHPDYEFVDAGGRAVSVPPDRVVPPHLAPPGLPLRQVRIPPPRVQGGSAS